MIPQSEPSNPKTQPSIQIALSSSPENKTINNVKGPFPLPHTPLQHNQKYHPNCSLVSFRL